MDEIFAILQCRYHEIGSFSKIVIGSSKGVDVNASDDAKKKHHFSPVMQRAARITVDREAW